MRQAGRVGLLLVLLAAATAQAQPPLDFDRLGVDEGLTDYVIMALTRDAAGFAWIGTQV
jgi:hypothetical protein